MTCTYCGSRNADDEHRCSRCGRRPGDSLSADYAPRTDGALAAQPLVSAQARSAPAPTAVARDLSRAVQRPLFQEKGASNVIPFDAYAPPRPEALTRKADPAKGAAKAPARRAPRVSEAQGSLDFLPTAPAQPRTLGTTVEAVIFCEAPVATPLHRAVAAALDFSMVLLGYGIFLAAYFLAGGEFAVSKAGLMGFAAALLLVAFTYGLLWVIAGTESAGMRWTRLRLTTFDGFPPERWQRVLRFAGFCMSLATVVGLLWSLADEESLTWQDHISRTFPTPRASESKVFHRVGRA